MRIYVELPVCLKRSKYCDFLSFIKKVNISLLPILIPVKRHDFPEPYQTDACTLSSDDFERDDPDFNSKG